MKVNEKIQSTNLYIVFQHFNQGKLEEGFKLLEKSFQEASVFGDPVTLAVHHSVYGVYYKLTKEFRKSWKHYEKAEKLMPEDPSLKLISSRLLLEYFGQNEIVIKKLTKLLENSGLEPSYRHQAFIVMGGAYLKKGLLLKAEGCLQESMKDDFRGLQTAANLDFSLVEAHLKKKQGLEVCKKFLEKAHAFCKKTKEPHYEKIISRLLKLFPINVSR